MLSAAPTTDPEAVTVREFAVPSAEPEPVELQLAAQAEPAFEPITSTTGSSAANLEATAETTAVAAPADANAVEATQVANATETAVAAAENAAARVEAAAVDASVAAAEPVLTPAPAPSETTATAAAAPAVPVEPETAAVPETVEVAIVDQPAPAAPARPAPQPEASAAEPSGPILNSPADLVNGVISGHQWIMRRDPDRFTIQLAAGANDRDLRLQARRNNMTNKAAIYRTDRNGTPWYSLIHGDFESTAEAREAIAALPEIWRSNSPWIRPFKSVQQVMQ